ncbi:MAG: FG-GAP-like repeat-containing protein [Acidobacteria bacterium]|nr:FG-GAP-like repeat-containing protein [Acidobacteriota bacterium]
MTHAAGLDFRHQNSATSNMYVIETIPGGVAVFDYDNDGWLDVFFVNSAKLKNPQPDGEALDKSDAKFWNRLFRNNHNGTFTDVTAKAGLEGSGYGMGVATGDYDNDGFIDLLVTHFGGSLLYRNRGDGTFADVTALSKVYTERWTTSAGFFDYDNDGHLDLFVCRYLEWDFQHGAMFCSEAGRRAYCHPDKFPPISNYLFRNNGDGTFTDVSQTSRIGSLPGKALGVAFADYDNDGLLDITVANDSFPQFLFRNNGDGTFSEKAGAAGVAYNEEGKTFAGMGTDFADIDNDGDPDIVTTALPYQYFCFFRNNGNGTFTDASLTSDLGRHTLLFGGWGMRIFDYDNDGSKDLFLATGHLNPAYRQKPLLLRNAGNTFANLSTSSGDIFDRARSSRGAAFGDLDNDGDIDLVISNSNESALCLRNEGGNKNHWIGLELHGTKSNRQGIGAKITLTSPGNQIQFATVSTAGSYLSANDPRVLFGLGREESVKEIHIQWPSGISQVILQPKIDQFLRVEERSPTAGPYPLQVTSGLRPEEPQQQPVKPLSPQSKGLSKLPSATRVDVAGAERKAEPKPKPVVQFRLGLSLLAQGKILEATKAFEEAIRLEPDYSEAHFELGVIRAQQGEQHYGAAIERFLEVLRLNRKHVDAHVYLSNLLEQTGDVEAAVAELKEAVSLEPERADLHVLYLALGQRQQKARKYRDAIASFQQALTLNPRLASAHYGIGLASRQLGDFSRSRSEFESALKINPGDAYSHYQLGKLLSHHEQLGSAATHLREALRLQPAMAEAYAELGSLYARQNKTEDAEKAFRAAIALNEKDVNACYGLAQLLQAKGDAAQAKQFFDVVQQSKQATTRLEQASRVNTEGLELMNTGHLDESLSAFSKALSMDPTLAAAAYNKGLVLARQNKIAEAIEFFRKAIHLRPGFVLAQYALGLTLQVAGDPSADQELRKAQLMKQWLPQAGGPSRTMNLEAFPRR